MVTISEIAATIIIWLLTAVGLFFGLRALWRKAAAVPGKRQR